MNFVDTGAMSLNKRSFAIRREERGIWRVVGKCEAGVRERERDLRWKIFNYDVKRRVDFVFWWLSFLFHHELVRITRE